MDKIHSKKKSWPHFDKLHLGGKAYAEGWDRIFGKKEGNNGPEVDEVGRGRKVQKTGKQAKGKGSKKPKGASRVHRSKEVRQQEIR